MESVLIGCAAHLRSPPPIVAIYVTKTYLPTMKMRNEGSAIVVACLILTTVLVTMGLADAANSRDEKMFVELELRGQENNAGVGMKGTIAGKKKVSKLIQSKKASGPKDTDSVGETGAESDATEDSNATDSKKSYFELQSYKTRTTDIYEFHDYLEDNRFLPGWDIKGCFDKPKLITMNVHHNTSLENCEKKLCHCYLLN